MISQRSHDQRKPAQQRSQQVLHTDAIAAILKQCDLLEIVNLVGYARSIESNVASRCNIALALHLDSTFRVRGSLDASFAPQTRNFNMPEVLFLDLFQA